MSHPRQMRLGMRSFQALQVQASSSRHDTSFNNIVLPIDSCHFQNYLFYAQTSQKEAKSQITFSSPQRAVYEEVSLIAED